MTERFTDRLRRLADAVWHAQHEHPFIKGIGDGTLEEERFKHWVRQDYRFLIEFARLLSMASARAPDLDAMSVLARLAHETLQTEMSLHRTYAARFGISQDELEQTAMAPTCRAYTDFLVRTASSGDFAEVVAALLPCLWGFSEVGRTLKARGSPEDPRYAEWIEMYGSDDFGQLATWCRELLDRVGQELPRRNQEAVEEAFLTSSRYELLFWEMAWKQEQWPV